MSTIAHQGCKRNSKALSLFVSQGGVKLGQAPLSIIMMRARVHDRARSQRRQAVGTLIKVHTHEEVSQVDGVKPSVLSQRQPLFQCTLG